MPNERPVCVFSPLQGPVMGRRVPAAVLVTVPMVKERFELLKGFGTEDLAHLHNVLETR